MTKSNIVQISRDPFARETLYRRSVQSDVGCFYCGQSRYGPSSNMLWQYGIEQDGICTTIHWDIALFCCIDCYRKSMW
jgi:hypothetical protein